MLKFSFLVFDFTLDKNKTSGDWKPCCPWNLPAANLRTAQSKHNLG